MDPSERPRLRSEVELLAGRPEEPEGALLYDPVQRSLYELDPDDLPILRLLDGSHSPPEIARQAGRPPDEVWDLLDDLSDMLLLEDPEQEDLLDDLRQEHGEEDRLLQPVLDSQPVQDIAARPIAVVDDARHTCLCCGACCHYAVPVSPEERGRLEQVEWPEEIVPGEAGRLFQLRPGLQWGRLEGTIATQGGPTRCAFLDGENLCRVHARLGAQAKPFACRLFPLAFPVVAPAGLLFSLTFECPYIFQTCETGERLGARTDELRALAAEMEEVYTLPAEVPLDEGTALGMEAYLAWEQELLEGVKAPATGPGAFLEELQRCWAAIAPALPGPVPTAGEMAALAEALGRVAREETSALADSPEGEAGSAWAVRVLEALAERPEEAWASLPWADGPAAGLFLTRFVRHFVGGKQHLLYGTLGLGLRALAVLLLLARSDAAMMERAAGRQEVSLQALNRALARWCRLLDIRPFRLAFLRIRS